MWPEQVLERLSLRQNGRIKARYVNGLSYDWLSSSHYRILQFTLDQKFWKAHVIKVLFSNRSILQFLLPGSEHSDVVSCSVVDLKYICSLFSAFCSEVCEFLNYEHRVFNSEEFLRSRETTDHTFYKRVNKCSYPVLHSAHAPVPNSRVCVCRF